MTLHDKPGYRILVGNEFCPPESLENPLGATEFIKIVPIVAGAHDGLVQYYLGSAIAAIGVVTYQPWLVSLGVAMALGGVSQMLATPPKVGVGQNGPSDMPAYSFGSPTVTIGQGRSVPVGYGEMLVGGAIVSAGIVSEGYQSKGFGGQAPDDNGTIGGNGDTLPWVAAIAPAS
jgi:predicted phage tail protein